MKRMAASILFSMVTTATIERLAGRIDREAAPAGEPPREVGATA